MPRAIRVFPGAHLGRAAFVDPRTAPADGEMEVTFEYAREDDRFKTFADFLSYDLGVTRDVIKNEQTRVVDDKA